MKRIKKWLAVVLAAAFLCASCGKANQPVKIGLIVSENTVVGEEIIEGASLLVQKWNDEALLFGRQIELHIYDDGSDPVLAMEAYRKCMAEKVLAIIGPSHYLPSLAVMQAAAEDGIPIITPTVTQEEPILFGKNCFSLSLGASAYGKAAASLMAENHSEKTAVLYDAADAQAKAAADAFLAAADSVVLAETVEDLTKAISKLINAQADALFVPGNADVVSAVADAAFNMGYQGEIFAYAQALYEEEKLHILGEFSVGSADKAFLSAFFDLYGREATVYNALGFEAANAALSAFNVAGEKNLKADEKHFKKLTEAFYENRFAGVLGEIAFAENGSAEKRVVLL
ncbi:MAG: hypothetical protein E7332_01750 [Clostridiales bacterium]|nr:hypothetical protein [Clostridiales bacterium]